MNDRSSVTDIPEDRSQPGDAGADGAEPETVTSEKEREEGSVRRPLIRATLKLPEGTPPTPRQPPVFTMHQQEWGGGSRGNGRSAGGSSHPNKKKNARDRSGQQASAKGNASGAKKRSSRSGRRSSARRDKGRSR